MKITDALKQALLSAGITTKQATAKEAYRGELEAEEETEPEPPKTMKTIKAMIANANACRPYYIDTAVYFSEGIARKKGGNRWAAGVDAMPQLPGMTCHPTAGGYFRYCVNEVPTDDVDTFKEPRLALLAQRGIPVQGEAQKAPATVKAKNAPAPKPQAPKSAPRIKPEQLAFQF